MYQLLVRLMLIAALAEFGMTVSDLRDCRGRGFLIQLEKRARDVLRVDWKPISVWPNEAERFR